MTFIYSWNGKARVEIDTRSPFQAVQPQNLYFSARRFIQFYDQNPFPGTFHRFHVEKLLIKNSRSGRLFRDPPMSVLVQWLPIHIAGFFSIRENQGLIVWDAKRIFSATRLVFIKKIAVAISVDRSVGTDFEMSFVRGFRREQCHDWIAV